MTNEEAKDYLTTLWDRDDINIDETIALEMAIKALETVSCIKEKCAYCSHCENCDVDDETLEIKALEQQPCEDWYDVPSNEMTLEQARQAVKDLRKKLAEYLEQKPCEDAISRQDALNCVTFNEFRYRIVEDIKALPSVTPKENTGHFIDDGFASESDWIFDRKYRCSSCNFSTYIKYGYCPNCGTRMEMKE